MRYYLVLVFVLLVWGVPEAPAEGPRRADRMAEPPEVWDDPEAAVRCYIYHKFNHADTLSCVYVPGRK